MGRPSGPPHVFSAKPAPTERALTRTGIGLRARLRSNIRILGEDGYLVQLADLQRLAQRERQKIRQNPVVVSG